MVAKYKDNYYSCVLNSKEQILLTGIKSKAVFGFEEDGDIFYKNITQEELCEIFQQKGYICILQRAFFRIGKYGIKEFAENILLIQIYVIAGFVLSIKEKTSKELIL